MKKRFWALFLAVMMVVSVLPTSAFAAEADPLSPAPNGDEYVTVGKTAERTGADEWKITMTIATDKIAIKPEPMDLVILMDTSYSMRSDISGNYYSNNTCRMEIAGPAAQKLVKDLAAADVNARVSVVTFDSGASTKKGLTQLTDENLDEITSAIPDTSDETSSGFGTNMTAGLNAAAGIFTGSNIKNKVIVMLGDGEPYNDSDGNNGPKDSTLATIKNAGITVHTIGFAINSKVLENIANKTDGNYYTTSSAEGLTAIFTDIKNELVAMVSDDMRSSTDSDVAIQDILVVPNGSSVSVSPDGKLMNWNPADGVLGENQTAIITYTVKLDNVNDFTPDKHTINLNGDAVLSYQAGAKTGKLKFPVPKADIEVAQPVTEIYLDDADTPHSAKPGQKIIVWEKGDNIVEWDAPADTIEVDGETYNYYESTYNGDETNAFSAVVDAGGTYTLKHYYISKPKVFDVTYKYTGEVPDGAPAVPETYKVTVGESYTVADKPTLTGYVFDGWKMDNEIVADFEMPDSNVELTGSWSLGEYGYTVEYYFDGKQDEDLTEGLEAVFGAEINSYPNKAGKDYCLDYDTAPITIGADASENVIKVYYAKDVWNDKTNQDDVGDGIPDKYQVRVKYVSNDANKGTVTPALDVITLYDAAGNYAISGKVTTSAATATAKEGNGFKNWTDYNGFEMAAEDETLSAQTIEGAEGGETYTYTAIFSAATQPGIVKIPYYIEHYQEQLDGTYVKVETETKFDVNEKEITIADADYKAYANYTPNKTHEDAVLSGIVGVSVDTSGDVPVATMLTLKLYYDLDEYTVTYYVDGEPVGEAETYRFGAEVTVEDKPAKEGYDFFGWSYSPDVEVNEEGKFTMPAANVTISGYFLQHCTVEASKDVYQLLDAEGKQFWPVELEGDAEMPSSTIETVAIPAVKAGETIIWKITVVNVGGQPGEFMLNELLAGVQVFADEACTEPVDLTQPFAIGAQGNNEATEYSIDFFAKYTVQEKDVAEIINKITVSGNEEPIVAPGVDVANIAVTKTADKTDVKVGDKVTYTITVKNEGTVALTNVVVTDVFANNNKGTLTVKSGDLNVGDLAADDSATIVLEYTTVADDVKGLKNTAVAEGNYDGEKTVDESDTEEVKVTKKSDPVRPVGPSKPALNKADHYAYIVGYPDGLVHPEKNITRAEVSTIFFRMLLDESREDFWAQENWFSDVPAHMWFNNAVSTLANAGLITGYPDGSFKPNANITRAEFATIAIRFFLEEDVEITENNLSDVKGHWAEANINLAYALNLINGYPDGTFRPDQKITRAEAMTIVNRVLERAPEKDHLLDDMIEWPDNMNKDAWYYAAVQEATNSHEFYRDSKNEYEVWTELLPVRDWAALEREWSQANSSKNPGEVVDINVSTPEAGN